MNACVSSGRSSLRSRSGGSADREDVQPVVEVLAQLAVAHGLQRVHVGRRDHAHVDRRLDAAARAAGSCAPAARAAASPASAASSRRSRRGRSCRDRPARSTPCRRSMAPVNAPFSCPKISLSSSVSGIAAQLIGDVRHLRARAQLMNRLRHQLLARARLARDQHRRRRRRGLLDDLVDAAASRGWRRSSCRRRPCRAASGAAPAPRACVCCRSAALSSRMRRRCGSTGLVR